MTKKLLASNRGLQCGAVTLQRNLHRLISHVELMAETFSNRYKVHSSHLIFRQAELLLDPDVGLPASEDDCSDGLDDPIFHRWFMRFQLISTHR